MTKKKFARLCKAMEEGNLSHFEWLIFHPTKTEHLYSIVIWPYLPGEPKISELCT